MSAPHAGGAVGDARKRHAEAAAGPKIRVTATDLESGDTQSIDIWNDYNLVVAGTAELTTVQAYRKADGTETHVITVKGIRRA